MTHSMTHQLNKQIAEAARLFKQIERAGDAAEFAMDTGDDTWAVDRLAAAIKHLPALKIAADRIAAEADRLQTEMAGIREITIEDIAAAPPTASALLAGTR